MVNSRNKGAAFERMVASLLRKYGYEARRGQQYCGANGDADVIGLPGVHLECKAVEKLNIYDAMAQAIHDRRPDEFPVVVHKKNYCKILVTMEFDDWMELYKEWEAGR